MTPAGPVRPSARAGTALATAAAAASALLAMAIADAGPARGLAQEAVSQVNGTVFGKDRKGVIGLTVAAIPASGGLFGTSTDEGGRYAFKGLDADTYTIVVALPGSGVLRKDGIRVRPLFRSIVDFNLAADAPGGTLPALVPAPRAGAPAGSGAGDAPATSIACTLAGADRTPAPDAGVVLTPVEGSGRLRRGRTDPDGHCVLADVPPGDYRFTVRAPGFITWSLGPLSLKGSGDVRLSMLLVPFPMGFEGTLEDKLVPADPVPPAQR